MASSATDAQLEAFLLTADWRDARNGHELHFWARSAELGPFQVVVDRVPPVFFVAREAELPPLSGLADRREVELRDFSGRPVDALYFHGQRPLREAADQLRGQGIAPLEADVHPADRFLMERFIHAQVALEGPVQQGRSHPRMRNPRVRPTEVTPELRVASLDIETGVSDGLLYSIAVHITGAGEERRRVWMLYDEGCETEAALLKRFLRDFAEEDPDVIIGWHVIGFDLAFLEQKCQRHNVRFSLGRGGAVPRLRKLQTGGWVARVSGRVVLDGPPTLRAAFYNFPDFRLETVAQVLLGRGKVITPDEDKVAEIERRFREDRAALAKYNLEDCVLVTEIFAATQLIDLWVRRSQISGLLLERIGASAAAFDHIYLPRLHRQGRVAICADDVVGTEHAAGGYVLEPETGLHEGVITLDFKSLYPTVIRSFKIDPFSRLEQEHATVETPSGHRFSRERHILPDYIAELMEARAQAKRDGDSHLSLSVKILMNSFYGVMGSFGCRFYHRDLPSAITGTGQWLLKESQRWLEERGYVVLYGDTDSLFVRLRPEDRDDPHARGHAIAAELTDWWRDRLREELDLESFLEMEYEKLFARLFLPPLRGGVGGAKKRYVGLVEDEAGKKHVHFVGMEVVRSDWTELAKRFQRGLYDRFFKDEALGPYVEQFIRSLQAGEHDEELVYQKRLRKRPDAYTRNVPPHVKAAKLAGIEAGEIRYIITRQGAVPFAPPHRDIDYRHYVQKQLRPIAEAVLGHAGLDFDEVAPGGQLSLL